MDPYLAKLIGRTNTSTKTNTRTVADTRTVTESGTRRDHWVLPFRRVERRADREASVFRGASRASGASAALLRKEVSAEAGTTVYRCGGRTFFLVTAPLDAEQLATLAFSQEVLRAYHAVRDNLPLAEGSGR